MSHLKDRERERKLEKIRGKARTGSNGNGHAANGNGNGGGRRKPPAAEGELKFSRREGDILADDLSIVSMAIERAALALTKSNITANPITPSEARRLNEELDQAAEKAHGLLMRVQRKRGFA